MCDCVNVCTAPNAKMLSDNNLNGNIALCPYLSFKIHLQYVMAPKYVCHTFLYTIIIHIILAHAVHYDKDIIISLYLKRCQEATCEIFPNSHYSLIIADIFISTKLLSSQIVFWRNCFANR